MYFSTKHYMSLTAVSTFKFEPYSGALSIARVVPGPPCDNPGPLHHLEHHVWQRQHLQEVQDAIGDAAAVLIHRLQSADGHGLDCGRASR